MLKGKDQKELEELKSKVADLTNKWKRALADYQNLEKRIHEERQNTTRKETARIIEKILASIDNLERSERHVKDQGLSLAVKSLKDVLEGEGIKEIEVIGKEFNPLEMECIEVVEGNKDNIVIEVIRKGYRLDDKILRVAQVKVSKVKKTNEESKN